MSQDPLQYLPIERWNELQSAFKTDWPRSISAYAVLETQRNLIEQGFNYGFIVYCPYGDEWNGMVAINEKDHFYEIIIQCPRDDTEKLEEALRRTKVIDWNRPIKVPFAPQHVIECLRTLSKGFELKLLPSEKFVYEQPTLFEDVSLPSVISFGLVSQEYLDLVDSTWPHRYPTSPWYFEYLINIKAGYGLFQDNQLIVWVFFNEAGNLLHMYTVESQRRKGYAEVLLKLVSNILIKQGKPIIVYCLKDNIKAIQLYTKLGFEKVDPPSYFAYLNKKV